MFKEIKLIKERVLSKNVLKVIVYIYMVQKNLKNKIKLLINYYKKLNNFYMLLIKNYNNISFFLKKIKKEYIKYLKQYDLKKISNYQLKHNIKILVQNYKIFVKKRKIQLDYIFLINQIKNENQKNLEKLQYLKEFSMSMSFKLKNYIDYIYKIFNKTEMKTNLDYNLLINYNKITIFNCFILKKFCKKIKYDIYIYIIENLNLKKFRTYIINIKLKSNLIKIIKYKLKNFFNFLYYLICFLDDFDIQHHTRYGKFFLLLLTKQFFNYNLYIKFCDFLELWLKEHKIKFDVEGLIIKRWCYNYILLKNKIEDFIQLLNNGFLEKIKQCKIQKGDSSLVRKYKKIESMKIYKLLNTLIDNYLLRNKLKVDKIIKLLDLNNESEKNFTIFEDFSSLFKEEFYENLNKKFPLKNKKIYFKIYKKEFYAFCEEIYYYLLFKYDQNYNKLIKPNYIIYKVEKEFKKLNKKIYLIFLLNSTKFSLNKEKIENYKKDPVWNFLLQDFNISQKNIIKLFGHPFSIISKKKRIDFLIQSKSDFYKYEKFIKIQHSFFKYYIFDKNIDLNKNLDLINDYKNFKNIVNLDLIKLINLMIEKAGFHMYEHVISHYENRIPNLIEQMDYISDRIQYINVNNLKIKDFNKKTFRRFFLYYLKPKKREEGDFENKILTETHYSKFLFFEELLALLNIKINNINYYSLYYNLYRPLEIFKKGTKAQLNNLNITSVESIKWTNTLKLIYKRLKIIRQFIFKDLKKNLKLIFNKIRKKKEKINIYDIFNNEDIQEKIIDQSDTEEIFEKKSFNYELSPYKIYEQIIDNLFYIYNKNKIKKLISFLILLKIIYKILGKKEKNNNYLLKSEKYNLLLNHLIYIYNVFKYKRKINVYLFDKKYKVIEFFLFNFKLNYISYLYRIYILDWILHYEYKLHLPLKYWLGPYNEVKLNLYSPIETIPWFFEYEDWLTPIFENAEESIKINKKLNYLIIKNYHKYISLLGLYCKYNDNQNYVIGFKTIGYIYIDIITYIKLIYNFFSKFSINKYFNKIENFKLQDEYASEQYIKYKKFRLWEKFNIIKKYKNYKKNKQKKNHNMIDSYETIRSSLQNISPIDTTDIINEIGEYDWDWDWIREEKKYSIFNKIGWLGGYFFYRITIRGLLENLAESKIMFEPDLEEDRMDLETEEFLNFIGDYYYLEGETYESYGLNGIILDIDNRFNYNFNNVTNFSTDQILNYNDLYIYLALLRDLFYINSLKIFSYLFIKIFYNIIIRCLILIIFCPIICLIYIYMLMIYIICILLNGFKNLIYYILLISIEKYINIYVKIINKLEKNPYLLKICLIYSLFFIIIGESLRVLIYLCIIKSKQIFYIKELNFFFLKKLIINCFLFFSKLILKILINIIRLIYIYIIFIFFFENYDNIMLFLINYTGIIFSYRTILFLYLIFLFILIIFFFGINSYIGSLCWILRYEFLGISLLLWLFSSYINSVDLLTVNLWGNFLEDVWINGSNFFNSFNLKVLNDEIIYDDEHRTILFFYHYNDNIIQRYLYSQFRILYMMISTHYVEILNKLYKSYLNLYYLNLDYKNMLFYYQNLNIFLSGRKTIIRDLIIQSIINENFQGQYYNKNYLEFLNRTKKNNVNKTFNQFVAKMFGKHVLKGNALKLMKEAKGVFRFLDYPELNKSLERSILVEKNFLLKTNLELWGNYKIDVEHIYNFYPQGLTYEEVNLIQSYEELEFYSDPSWKVTSYKPLKFRVNFDEAGSGKFDDFLFNFDDEDMFLKDMHYSYFYERILIPDLGFMGSPYWAVDIELLQRDKEILNDGILGSKGI